MDPSAILSRGAAAILGTPPAERQLESIERYLDCLEAWNRVHRLVGRSDRGWLVREVILDSLLFLQVLPETFQGLLDIGSGAGVPGIPIAIMRPGMPVTLVESRRKRVSFLANAIRSTGLSGVSLIHGRAESLVDRPDRFDVIVARCAGKPDAIMRLGSMLVSPRGLIVVAGAPGVPGPSGTRRVEVLNPVTGAARAFVVRDGPAHPGRR